MERTKKLLSWIALGVLLMSNTLTPRTYAQENVEEIEDSINQIEEITDQAEEIMQNPVDSENLNDEDFDNQEGEEPVNEQKLDEGNLENPENLENQESKIEDESDEENNEEIQLDINFDENIIETINKENTNIEIKASDKKAKFLPGLEFSKAIKGLAKGEPVAGDYDPDTLITNILSGTVPGNLKNDDHKISSSDSANPIYAYFNNGIIYYDAEGADISLNEDSSFMFYNLKKLEGFNIEDFDTSNVTSMKYMFGNTETMESINLKAADLNNVEDMSFMFYGAGLTSIDLSGKNLNKVTTLMDMFYNAKNLVTVDFTNIKLELVTSIDTMFPYDCTDANLEEVKFTNAKIGNLERIGPSLFYKLNNLKYVDFSGADLHGLKNPGTMFNQNNNLQYVNFSHADLRSLEEIGIFSNVPELTGLNFSHAILSGLVYGRYTMVHQAPKLKEVDFSYADLRNFKGQREDSYKSLKGLINVSEGYTPNIEIFNFSNADLRSLTSLESMFSQSTKLKEVNFENTRLDSLTTMENMFYHAKLPETLIFKNNNTINLRTMRQMFYNSYSGENIDLSRLNLGAVETMESMFVDAKDIKKVNFKNVNLKNLATMQYMFQRTKDLEEVDFEGAEFENLGNVGSMFDESNIKEFNFTGKELKNGAYMSNMFYNAKNLEKVDFSNTKIGGSSSYMGTMFGNTEKLREANFKNFEVKGGNMASMFQFCSDLEKIDFENALFLGGGNLGTFVYQADKLQEVNFSGAKFIGGFSLRSFISNATILEKVNFSNALFSGGGEMNTFFYGDDNLKEIDFGGAKFIGNYILEGMFSDKQNLEKINFDNTEINGSMNMQNMFKNATKIRELDLSSWNTSKTTNMNGMFNGANNLRTIYVGDLFSTGALTSSSNMFSGATSIVGGNGTTYDANHIDAEYARIDTPEISGYFTNILDKPYKITYNLDGGSLAGEKTTYTQRDTFTLPTPTKQGYIFKGWIGSNGNNPQVEVRIEAGRVKGNLEYTAIWELDSGSHSSGGGGKRSEPTTSEVTNDTTQEHNSADDNTTKPSDTTAPLNEETSKEVISVTQEIAEDGTEVEVVVEAVAIKNTNIVATVRTETPVNGTTSSTYSSSTHTQEQADAYSFAKANGITTTESIETAKMNTELTRIQMAKMLSNFAINVLGEEPDVSKGTADFDDVTNKMDKQYDDAVTKAYQLGIMGQNVKDNEFRPNDGVTRAEFTTALSRLLYKTDEGEYKGTSKYYIPHIVKLYNEGIVNKAEPKIKEKRGYVMTMLKRTVE